MVFRYLQDRKGLQSFVASRGRIRTEGSSGRQISSGREKAVPSRADRNPLH